LKLLFTSNFFPPETQGGYELRLFHLVETLKKEHTCIVVTSGSTQLGESVSNNPHKIFNIFSKPFGTSGNGIIGRWKDTHQSQKDAIRFAEVLQAEKPDWVCHFSLAGCSPALAAVCNILNIPQCFWYEDVWSSSIPLGKDSIYHPWFQIHQNTPSGGFSKLAPLVRIGLPTGHGINRHLHLPPRIKADLKIAVSHYQEWKNREDFISTRKSVVIQPGIPFDPHKLGSPTRKLQQKINLVYAGALTPDRGFNVLFEALRMMEPEIRNRFQLKVFGKPPNDWAKNWWQAFTRKTEGDPTWDIITCEGWIKPDSIATMLEVQDVLVFPSARGEGMPLIMQEAMIQGCLVISSGSGGAGELCADAHLPTFPSNCPYSLKQELLKLLDTEFDWEMERKRLQEYALKLFSIEKMADAFVRLLKTEKS